MIEFHEAIARIGLAVVDVISIFEWPWTTLIAKFWVYKQAVLVLPTPNKSSAVIVKVL